MVNHSETRNLGNSESRNLGNSETRKLGSPFSAIVHINIKFMQQQSPIVSCGRENCSVKYDIVMPNESSRFSVRNSIYGCQMYYKTIVF